MKELPTELIGEILDYSNLWYPKSTNKIQRFQKYCDSQIIDTEISKIKRLIENMGETLFTKDDVTSIQTLLYYEDKIKTTPDQRFLEICVDVSDCCTKYHISHVIKYFRQFMECGFLEEDSEYIFYIKISNESDLEKSFENFDINCPSLGSESYFEPEEPEV